MGKLMVVVSGAGYGFAYPDRADPDWRSITVNSGTLCLLVGRDAAETRLRGQPMVRVLVEERVLTMDERFLREVT